MEESLSQSVREQVAGRIRGCIHRGIGDLLIGGRVHPCGQERGGGLPHVQKNLQEWQIV